MSKTAKKSKAPAVVLVIMLVVLGGVLGIFAFDYLNGERHYTLLYEDSIAAYAKEYGLDPYMVAAVIHTESGFDPNAVSHAGAIGLMQVMPETGEWIAGKLGVEPFDINALYDPDTNIRFGCWYLGFLRERFGGANELVWAGYNAGQGRVDEWLADPAVSADGVSLTDIPFEETADYVKKVETAYKRYKELYEIS